MAQRSKPKRRVAHLGQMTEDEPKSGSERSSRRFCESGGTFSAISERYEAWHGKDVPEGEKKNKATENSVSPSVSLRSTAADGGRPLCRCATFPRTAGNHPRQREPNRYSKIQRNQQPKPPLVRGGVKTEGFDGGREKINCKALSFL